MKKKKMGIFLSVIGICLITGGIFLKDNTKSLEENKTSNNVIPQGTPERDESREEGKGQKEETSELDEISYVGDEVSTKNINLNNYHDNIVIKTGGEYTLTGNFEHSIYIDSDETVTLKLNNVSINTREGAAISNVNENNIIINVNANTKNKISDGKESNAFDGCIFSNGPLTIKGKGILEIYGNQKDGEGIATKNSPITISEANISIYSNDDGINTGGDGGTITINSGSIYIEAGGDAIDSNKDAVINGGKITGHSGKNGVNAAIDVDDTYEINGGNILMTGTDHIDLPQSSSKGKILCFELVDAIPKNTLIVLTDINNKVVFSLTTISPINTILYSDNKLQIGDYYLYKGGAIKNGVYTKGTSITIKKNEKYSVNGNINAYIE